MKNFNNKVYAENYINDISLKIPGYDLMFDLIFKGVIPVEMQSTLANILSVGGGEIEMNNLLELFPNASYTLLDSSQDMLNMVKNSINSDNSHIEYINQSFEESKLKNDNYQLILSLLVAHFIEDKETFFKEIYRVLDKEGIFIVSAFSNQHLDWWKEYTIANGANKADVLNTYNHQEKVMKSIDPNELELLVKEIGYSKVEKVAQILSIDLWILKK